MNANYIRKYSEGEVVVKKNSSYYSSKFYEMVATYEETITKYEILVKHKFELELIYYLKIEKLKK